MYVYVHICIRTYKIERDLGGQVINRAEAQDMSEQTAEKIDREMSFVSLHWTSFCRSVLSQNVIFGAAANRETECSTQMQTMGASSVSKFVECIPEIIIFSSCPDAAQQVYIGEPLPVQVPWGHGMVSSAPFKEDSTPREETGGPEAKRWKSL